MLLAAFSAISLAAAAAAQQVVIQVGGNSSTPGGVLQYIPSSVNASNGTVVTFRFAGIPGNHSVSQSSFANPCNLTRGGFDSGWVQILTNPGVTPEWNITITDDTKPLWFFCKQKNSPTGPHCNAGMVGGINVPTTGNITYPAFQAKARAHTGSSDQNNGNLVGLGASASALPSPVPSGVTLFGSPTPGAASPTATGASATGSAAAGTGSGTGASSSSTPSSTSAASQIAASSILVLFAAALGFTMV